MGVDNGSLVDQKSYTLLFKFSDKLDMRGRRPEAAPSFLALRFTVLGSGQRTTQMFADRSPQ
jgi:hypothetical protein